MRFLLIKSSFSNSLDSYQLLYLLTIKPSQLHSLSICKRIYCTNTVLFYSYLKNVSGKKRILPFSFLKTLKTPFRLLCHAAKKQQSIGSGGHKPAGHRLL